MTLSPKAFFTLLNWMMGETTLSNDSIRALGRALARDLLALAGFGAEEALVDPLGERRRHVDRRVRAHDEPDEQREREVLDDARPPDEEHDHRQRRHAARDDRAAKHLGDAQVDDGGEAHVAVLR